MIRSPIILLQLTQVRSDNLFNPFVILSATVATRKSELSGALQAGLLTLLIIIDVYWHYSLSSMRWQENKTPNVSRCPVACTGNGHIDNSISQNKVSGWKNAFVNWPIVSHWVRWTKPLLGGVNATCEYVKSCGASLTICSFLNGHSYTVDNYVALTSCRIPL